MENLKNIVIYSAKIAKCLMENGFRCVSIKANKKNTKKMVFYFKNTERIKVFLEENFKIGIKNS